MQCKKWMVSGAVLAAVLAGLTGCGGSVDAVPAPEVEVPAPELPQGIWRGKVGSDDVSVIVLPVASPSAGVLWAIGRDSLGATRLFKADLTLSGQTYAGTGSVLTSSPANVDAGVGVAVAGVASAPATLSLTLGTETTSLATASYYANSATLAHWTGQWQNTQALGSAGNLVTDWTVSADGEIAGTRSDGCSYVGSVALRPEAKAVVDITLAETCASTTLNFSGIGSPGVDAQGNVIGRIATMLRADGQSFSVLLFTATPP